MNEKNVLLIGGTGALGSYALKELVSLGYSLDVITLEDCENFGNVRFYKTCTNEKNLAEFLEGKDYSAIVDFIHYSHIEYPYMLELLTSHTDQLVFLSSYRVYGNESHPIKEDSKQLTDFFSSEELQRTMQDYPLEKSLCENIIKESAFAKKVTVVRPVISFYHGRLSFITLKAPNIILRSGKKPMLAPIEAKKIIAGYSFSGNAGKQIAHLIGKEAALGEAFTVGGDEKLTWGEIGEYFTEALGSEFVWVDSETFLNYTTPNNTGEYYGLYNDRLINRDMDISKVLSVTGIPRSELILTREAIFKEAEIIKKDPERYINGYNEEIEKNQEKYFKEIMK